MRSDGGQKLECALAVREASESVAGGVDTKTFAIVDLLTTSVSRRAVKIQRFHTPKHTQQNQEQRYDISLQTPIHLTGS